ncbi:MAG: hypothetical protein RMA76_38215 [Deltaproteobacteria bacterium]|jgi:hypothetical protein
MSLDRAKVKIPTGLQHPRSQSALIVMLETQLGERTGCRITTDNAERIFFDALDMGHAERQRMIAGLAEDLANTPQRRWDWTGGTQEPLDLEAA